MVEEHKATSLLAHTISFEFIEWDQSGGDKATLYNIQVTFYRPYNSITKKSMMRDRYSSLLEFHKSITGLIGKTDLPEFPGKKAFGSKS